MHRYRADVVLILALWLAGCTGPHLVATAGPPDSSIYVDGRRMGAHGYAEQEFGYYGQVALSARVNPRPERDQDYLEQHLLVPMPVPCTRWLFPLDFFWEVVSYPFADPYTHEVNLALQPRPLLVPGVADPQAAAIRDRALQTGLAR